MWPGGVWSAVTVWGAGCGGGELGCTRGRGWCGEGGVSGGQGAEVPRHQTSLMPIMMETTSGEWSRTSRCHLAARSGTLLPLMPRLKMRRLAAGLSASRPLAILPA